MERCNNLPTRGDDKTCVLFKCVDCAFHILVSTKSQAGPTLMRNGEMNEPNRAAANLLEALIILLHQDTLIDRQVVALRQNL